MKPNSGTTKSTKAGAPATKKFEGFSKEEHEAMRDYIKEKRGAAAGVEGEEVVLAKIAALKEPDRSMAKQLHALIKASAPTLTPKTWYGMPAYAKDDKVVCFFQPGAKFKTRYSTLGFSDKAKLDEGNMWPNSYALTALTPAVEARISALLKKAIG